MLFGFATGAVRVASEAGAVARRDLHPHGLACGVGPFDEIVGADWLPAEAQEVSKLFADTAECLREEYLRSKRRRVEPEAVSGGFEPDASLGGDSRVEQPADPDGIFEDNALLNLWEAAGAWLCDDADSSGPPRSCAGRIGVAQPLLEESERGLASA